MIPTFGLLHTMAREVTHDLSLIDDLVQEGMIHAWLTEQKFPGKPGGYYSKSAKTRMNDIANRNRPMLGERSRRGYPIDPLRLPHVSLEGALAMNTD